MMISSESLRNFVDNDIHSQNGGMSDVDYDGSSGFNTGSGEDDTASVAASEAKDRESRRQMHELAVKETRNVRMWRRMVFLVLFATAALVTTLAFLFLQEEDEELFTASVRSIRLGSAWCRQHSSTRSFGQNILTNNPLLPYFSSSFIHSFIQFQQYALTIQDSTEFNVFGVLEATGGLSEVLTSEAVKTNSEWPFVTLSSFEVFVRHTRAQAASEMIVVSPIVSQEDLQGWADYSTQNQGWIDESFEANEDKKRADLNPIPSAVYRFGRYKGRTVLKPEDGAGDYPAAPFWQMSPPPFDTSIVNFNSLSTEEYQRMYDVVQRKHDWTFGTAGPNTLIDYAISQGQHDALHSESSQLVQNEQGRSDSSNFTAAISGFANDHPHTALMYPVYRELNNRDSDIVATVINTLPWDNYLKGALPDGVNGV
jgi:hypothetical protein